MLRRRGITNQGEAGNRKGCCGASMLQVTGDSHQGIGDSGVGFSIGSWFLRLIPERLVPELPVPVAVTRHPKLYPSQSSGLPYPLEFHPLALGRVGTASRHSLHQAAAGRLKVGAWLRRALRSGVHDESCPYLRSPCGERGQHAVLPLPQDTTHSAIAALSSLSMRFNSPGVS